MSSDNGSIDKVHVPINLAARLGAGLQRREDLVPHAGLAPAVEPARHRPGRAVPFGQVPPGGAGAQHPETAPRDSTQRMPLRIVRWSSFGRPVRGLRGGSKGSSRSPCVSVRSKRPMTDIMGSSYSPYNPITLCGHALVLQLSFALFAVSVRRCRSASPCFR